MSRRPGAEPTDDVVARLREGAYAVPRARFDGHDVLAGARRALRRRRRRQLAGAAAAAALVIAATLGAATLLPGSASPPPRPAPSRTSAVHLRALDADADPLNLAGATAGSLSGNAGWLAGLRQRVVVDERSAPDAAHVRVLWAADHAGQRHALTLARKD